MPATRKTKEMSALTILRWLKIYYAEIPAMIDRGDLYEAEGKRVAKGLMYSIKALEDSHARFKRVKRAEDEDRFKAAQERLS